MLPEGQQLLEGGLGTLTLHAEHAHFVRVRHGDVEDGLVAGGEVLGASGPQDHLGHVLQVWGRRQEEVGTERTALGRGGTGWRYSGGNNTTSHRHCCMSHMKVGERVNPKRAPLENFFSISLTVYLYEMMDVY